MERVQDDICVYCCDGDPENERRHEAILESEYTICYLTSNELRNHTQTHEGKLVYLDYRVNFCPMCGRELV